LNIVLQIQQDLTMFRENLRQYLQSLLLYQNDKKEFFFDHALLHSQATFLYKKPDHTLHDDCPDTLLKID
jgi:hypothetical protein